MLKERGIIFDWTGTLYQKNKGLFPYTEKVLRALQPKYCIGLVSFAREGIETRMKELESSEILYYFDSVIVSKDKGSEQYLQCMREMGTTPQTTIVVDDRTRRGIMIGNQLGCETFWIQKGEYAAEIPNQETGEPTHRIDSIEELLNFL